MKILLVTLLFIGLASSAEEDSAIDIKDFVTDLEVSAKFSFSILVDAIILSIKGLQSF